MKNGTDREKAFLCAFSGVIIASQPYFPGKPSKENLLATEEHIRRFNVLVEYFQSNSDIQLDDPNEIHVSNEKTFAILRAVLEKIEKEYSYLVISAFQLGKLAATIFQARYSNLPVQEDTLQEFNEKCEELGIDGQAKDIFLKTLEPITFVKEFHKTEKRVNSMTTYNNYGSAGAMGEHARSDGNTIIINSEQKQNLAKDAAEILNLLKSLEQTNPTAIETEQVAYVNDETTPNFKRRVTGALQASGETAIDEFILENKYLKVAKAAVKGWLQPSG
jgi:hypothetical protein